MGWVGAQAPSLRGSECEANALCGRAWGGLYLYLCIDNYIYSIYLYIYLSIHISLNQNQQ